MPEKVKILKAVDNDTFKVQLKDGTTKNVRLVSGNNQAWYDGFEKGQPGFKLDEAVSNLVGKEVDINFRKLSGEQSKVNYSRELGSISTATIPDLAEHLFNKSQIYKRDTGKDWSLNKTEVQKDSLINPQQFKAIQSILVKKESDLEPKKILAYKREIESAKKKFDFKTNQELVDFVKRRSNVPYESLETFKTQLPLTQSIMATPPNKTLKVNTNYYKDSSKQFKGRLSVEAANALIEEGKINGTSVEDLKSSISSLANPSDLVGFEHHIGGNSQYLYPVFKGNTQQAFNTALKNNEGQILTAFGNRYATSEDAIQKWKDQFGINADYTTPAGNSVKPVIDSKEISKKENTSTPKFKTVEERNSYYKNLEDQNIKQGIVKNSTSNFEIGLPSKEKLLKEGLFNFKNENNKNTDPNDSWYLGSGSEREFSGLEKTIVGGTTVGTMFKAAKKIPFVNAIPIAANTIINLKKEAELGDLEWEDAARESQKVVSELLLLSTLQKVGGSKTAKWLTDKTGKLIPSTQTLKGAGKTVLKYSGKGVSKTWKAMEKALGEVTEEAAKKATYDPKKWANGIGSRFKQGGILKFQNGQMIPYANGYQPSVWNPTTVTNTPPVNYSGRSSMGKNVTTPYNFSFVPTINNSVKPRTDPYFQTKADQMWMSSHGAGLNVDGKNGRLTGMGRATNYMKPLGKPAQPYYDFKGSNMGRPIFTPDYTGMGSNDFSTMSDKPVNNTKTNSGFGYQEANLALSVLPALLNTKVKADRLTYQPYNPMIRGIQGDPLLQQRLTSIAQNKYLQNKATSSDPTQELVRRLVVNKQAMQGNQEAYNVDTQARIADTQRYYGERNAANQFNYTNKQNIDNQNIQMNNNAMMQNAAQKNQVTGQTIQNIMGYMTNKANDQNLLRQNYLVHKNIENQGALDAILPEYTARYNALYASNLSDAEKAIKAREIGQELAQKQAGIKKGFSVNPLYAPVQRQLGTWYQPTPEFKRGGTISDAVKVLSINTKKSTDTDKVFIDSARKYNELSSKVSTAALDRGSRLVISALSNLPKTTLKSLPFKKLF